MNPVRNKIPAVFLLWPERISPEWMPFGHNGMNPAPQSGQRGGVKIRPFFRIVLTSVITVFSFAPAQAIGVLVRMKSPPKDGGY